MDTRTRDRTTTAAIALLVLVAALPTAVVADPFPPDPLAPVADFGATATNELAPVAFLDASTDPETGLPDPANWTYAWDFGGLGDSAERNPTFDFHDGGDFAVRLTVTDQDGRAGNVERWVHVAHLPPAPAFTAAVQDDLTPVAFTSTTTHPSPIDNDPATWTYAWDFAGLASSTARNPTYLFPGPGPFLVRLTVTDDDGLAASVERSITVPTVPKPAFAAAAVRETEAVAFTDLTTDPGAPAPQGWSYAWDFAGLGNSTARHPTFRFAEGGTYAISLQVTDHLGRIGTITRDVFVPHVSPEAGFRFTVLQGGQLVVEDRSAHPNPADADPAGWAFGWTFSDGATASGRQASHTFAQVGPVQVTLAVTDDDGIVGTITRTIDLADLSPLAAFVSDGLATTPGPWPPYTSRPLQFHDLSTDDRGIVSWHWNFGDGTTSAVPSPAHQYLQPGDYQVILEATDAQGGFGAATGWVHVCNNPIDVRQGGRASLREFHFQFYPDGGATFQVIAQEAGLYAEACLAVNP